jgi:hypothetical protein
MRRHWCNRLQQSTPRNAEALIEKDATDPAPLYIELFVARGDIRALGFKL